MKRAMSKILTYCRMIFMESSIRLLKNKLLTDETGYLSANPANKKHVEESMASEPTVSFSSEEFEKHVETLLKSVRL